MVPAVYIHDVVDLQKLNNPPLELTSGLLANEFSRQLKIELGDDRYAELVKAHIADHWTAGESGYIYQPTSYCLSHDYCDANEVMAVAFRIVMERDMPFADDNPESEKQNEKDTILVNAAWNEAKATNFMIRDICNAIETVEEYRGYELRTKENAEGSGVATTLILLEGAMVGACIAAPQ